MSQGQLHKGRISSKPGGEPAVNHPRFFSSEWQYPAFYNAKSNPQSLALLENSHEHLQLFKQSFGSHKFVHSHKLAGAVLL